MSVGDRREGVERERESTDRRRTEESVFQEQPRQKGTDQILMGKRAVNLDETIKFSLTKYSRSSVISPVHCYIDLFSLGKLII